MIKTQADSHKWGARLRTGLVLAAAIAPLGISGVARAIDRNWNVGTGNWNVNANWSPALVPIAGDDVKIIENDAVNRIVTINVNTAVLKSLTIDNTGLNTISLTGAFKLSTTAEEAIGFNANAQFNQSAGTNSVGSALEIGQQVNASGTYSLSGGSLTVGGNTFIGYAGNGEFDHSGGSATFNGVLTLGQNADGFGTYSMSNGASLTTNLGMTIGSFGGGEYNQTGGTHNATKGVTVGDAASGHATVTGGTWTIAGVLAVAANQNGFGVFTHTGGSVILNDTSSQSLDIGYFIGSLGQYQLSGTGDLHVAGTENIGFYGKGFFTQSGGTHTAAALLVGTKSGSTGSASLSLGTWTVNNFAAIGWDGSGSFDQSGGKFSTIALAIAPHPGSTGIYTMSGGQLSASTLDIGGGNGSATFSGGTVSIPTINIHRGGTLTLAGATMAANLINNSGQFNITADTTINALTQALSGNAQIDANLTMNGALNNDLGAPIDGTGQITLKAPFTGWGTITPAFGSAADITARNGNLLFTGATFAYSATLSNEVGSTLVVKSPFVLNSGNMIVNTTGSIVFGVPISIAAGKSVTLAGGALSTGGLTNTATGTISGFGQIVGPLANDGTVTLSGPSQFIGPVTNSATGKLTVKNSQLLITGATTNNGVIHAQAGGSIVFDGGLTGNPVAGSVPLGAASLDASSALLTPFIRQTSLMLGGTAGDPNSYSVATIRPKAEGGQTSLLGSLTFQTDGSGALLGKLDLTDNALIVNYTGASALTDIRKAIRSAYNAASAAHWTGAGLTSSIAAKVAGTALGYAEASDVLGLTGAQTADFQGQTADATSVLVRYTLMGDTNLDGTVNFIDLVHVAQNYGLSTGNATWLQGDSNYDGNVDFQDLVALAQHYGASLPAPAGELAIAPASVPEPATTFLLLTATGAITLRRRSRPWQES